jgi:glycosyltransferase involved in cell wall biosynthesis
MTERIRVLQVLTNLAGHGGIQEYVTTVALDLDRSRFDVEVACGPGDGPYRERLLEGGIVVHDIDLVRAMHPWRDGRALFQLVRLLRKGRYSIVHTHMTKGGLVGRVAAFIARTPLVIAAAHNFGALHFNSNLISGFFWVYDKVLVAAFTDVVVSTSEVCSSAVVNMRMIPRSKIVTISAGIDLNKFDDAVRDREERTFSAAHTWVGTVTRLVRVKGIPDLILAAQQIVADHPDVRFAIVGDGPQREALEEMVEGLGLSDTVKLLGPRDDVIELLHDLDVFVLSSHSEGLPSAVMEAMAAARPIVATAVGGVKELVADGESGILVEPRDPTALAGGIVSLLEDPERARKLGDSARARLEARFTLDQTTERLGAFYLERTAATRSP